MQVKKVEAFGWKGMKDEQASDRQEERR